MSMTLYILILKMCKILRYKNINVISAVFSYQYRFLVINCIQFYLISCTGRLKSLCSMEYVIGTIYMHRVMIEDLERSLGSINVHSDPERN